MATLQKIICHPWCAAPRTDRGRVPGGDCMPYGLDETVGIFTPCDDGEGYCPAPDCQWHGDCICLCHT